MMKRKLCLQLHFEVTIEEPNLIENASNEEAQEHYARQKRVYDALVTNPASLEAYQVYLLANALDSVSWEKWYTHFLGSPDVDAKEVDDILHPIIATLSKQDQQWFKEAEDEGYFYESIEDSIINCFASIQSVNIREEDEE